MPKLNINRKINKEPLNPNRGKKNKQISYLKKIFFCLIIFTVIQGLNKVNTPLTQKFTDNIKYLLTYNYDFNKAIEESKVISFFQSKIKPEVLKMVLNQPDYPSQNEENISEGINLPVSGEITSGFGIRVHPILKDKRMHNGIDISADEGSDIRVILNGEVKKVWEDTELGKYVIVAHDNGMETMYAHCSKILVEEGDKVIKGQIIAKVGNTGLADGSHLHFEVWLDGEPVDPLSTVFKHINKNKGGI